MPSLVHPGTSAFCPLVVNYRNVLIFANALIQSTVINHLVYINQISRKDFISPKTLIFSHVLYKVLAPPLLGSKEQPCDVITTCLALQIQAFITEHAGQPVSSQALVTVPHTAAGRNLTTCLMKRIISCSGSELNSPWPWMSDVSSFIKASAAGQLFVSHFMANRVGYSSTTLKEDLTINCMNPQI